MDCVNCLVSSCVCSDPKKDRMEASVSISSRKRGGEVAMEEPSEKPVMQTLCALRKGASTRNSVFLPEVRRIDLELVRLREEVGEEEVLLEVLLEALVLSCMLLLLLLPVLGWLDTFCCSERKEGKCWSRVRKEVRTKGDSE